jgi:high-affinity iron transporter
VKRSLAVFAVLLVLAVFVWQGLAAHGNPDPTQPGLSPGAMILGSGVLVFREGLEAILILAAVTAGMARTGRKDYLRAIPVGATAGFAATIATWFIIVAALSHIPLPELDIQAATGLVAIIVLLVVMNWFFHKIYWTGWIANHSNRRKRIMEADCKECVDGTGCGRGGFKTFVGLALLGFTAIYREGFEVVLFLQNLRIKAGDALVLKGTIVGLVLTGIVAALTFVAHKQLPYKKMLIATGGLLLLIMLVMVGEEAQEMQQAGWLATHTLRLPIPGWMGVWFSVFPTVETLVAQVIAAVAVIGSYLWATKLRSKRPPAPLVELTPNASKASQMPAPQTGAKHAQRVGHSRRVQPNPSQR